MFLVQFCQLLELHNLTQINLGQSCKHLTYETTHLQPISIYCDFRSFLLTVTILETGGYGVPSKSQKSSIWGGVGPTITLKSPGRGALPSTPSRGLQGSQGVLTPPTRFSDKISSHPAGVRGTKFFFVILG